MRLFRRSPPVPSTGLDTPSTDLDAPLLHWARGAPWSVRDSFQNTMIFGSTGSGKSSGSMAAIARAMLRAGYGVLFLTVKRDDRTAYESVARDAGRGKDLRVYSPSAPLRFNFIAEEAAQAGDAVGLAETLTALVMTVAELGDHSQRSGGSGGSGGASDNEAYFRRAASRLCRNAMLVLALCGDELTMPNLHRLIVTLPQSREDARSPQWQAGSFFFRCAQAAASGAMTASQRADFDLAIVFFMEEWAGLSPRTRSTVESTLTAATDALARGAARDTLSAARASINFTPSMLERGSVVIVDYPVLVHREVARLIQVVLKYAVQRHLGRRDVGASPRPVAIVCDECQHLIVEADQLFATTSRSSRTALVYATQSVSTLLEALGGESAEPRMHSLLGNMQTQVHHQQTDVRTIEYVQALTGRSLHSFVSTQSQPDEDWIDTIMGRGKGSAGLSESYEFELQARDLNGLAKGGPPRFLTEAIVYQGGRAFPGESTWMRVAIPQRVARPRQ